MNHFDYHEGRLFAEDVPLTRIAEGVGTPVYVYATATLERHYRVFCDALGDLPATVCYALKANGNLGVVRTLADLGAGADVVSEGELRRALAAGVPAGRIVFSGVGKTARELTFALDQGVRQINVESEEELLTLDALARERGVPAPVAIRVNPDVDAGTHDKITTGLKENKFGIEWTGAHTVFHRAAALEGIRLMGAAVHIGSQLTDLDPFRTAFTRLRDLVLMLRADGIHLETLDLGGGLGVPYGDDVPPLPNAYGAVVRETVGDLGLHLIFEPGRVLTANAGLLLTRVVRVKEGATRSFVVVDAGMNDLVRPALYDATHGVRPVVQPVEDGYPALAKDVVGPICETGDTFATQRVLPPLAAGDLLTLDTAGAYGAVMANSYNGRPLVPEVLVNGDAWAVTRDRPDWDAMLAGEHVATWQTGPSE